MELAVALGTSPTRPHRMPPELPAPEDDGAAEASLLIQSCQGHPARSPRGAAAWIRSQGEVQPVCRCPQVKIGARNGMNLGDVQPDGTGLPERPAFPAR